MEKIVSIDEWIALRHPHLIVSDHDRIEGLAHTPGTAWMHLYSFKTSCDYVVEYDAYKEVENEYLEYVENVKRKNEIDRKKQIFS